MGRAAFLYKVDPAMEEKFVRPHGADDDGVDWGDAEVDIDGIYGHLETVPEAHQFFLDKCFELLNAVASLTADVYVLGAEIWSEDESAIGVLTLEPEEAKALVSSLPDARMRFADPIAFAAEMEKGGWVEQAVELTAAELREVADVYEAMVAFLAANKGGTYFVTVG